MIWENECLKHRENVLKYFTPPGQIPNSSDKEIFQTLLIVSKPAGTQLLNL